MPISQVSLSNTFNEFRQTTNLAINEVNKLTDGTADLVIDSITANTFVGVSSTLNISANSGTDAVSIATETLRIVGTNGISTSVASTSNTINVTLGATTVTSGAYGNANQVSVVFVDAQGRIASATNTSINILISGNTGSDIVTLGSEVFRFVGTNGISTTIASNTVDVTLGSSGVTAAAYGNANQVSTFVVNAQGRITSAGNTNIELLISGNTGSDVVTFGTETLRVIGTNGISTSIASTSNTINVTLGATTVTSGAYGNANQVPVVFVDAQGRIASATNTSINILISGNTGSDTVTLGTEVLRFVGTNGISTTIGSASNTVDVTLGSSGVTAGAYGSTTQIPTFSVNAQGRITSAGNTNIVSGATLTNDVTTNLDTFYPVLANNQTSGALSIANTSSTKLYYNANTGQLNATNFNSLSDARQKENIRTIQNATDKVLLIRGVTFNWIDNKKSSLGVIAQEVEQIIPDAVSTSTSGEKSVNYGALVGLLVETVKEQNIRIEKLESLISK